MAIGFTFRDVINSRSAGSDALHYNEQYTIVDIGGGTAGFITDWLPLDIASPDYRRLKIRTTQDDDTTLVTEVLALPVGANEFYCDYATGTVTIDPALMGTDVYATYNGPDNFIAGETHAVPAADIDDLCRVILTEIPLEFNLSATPDPRSIDIVASVHGVLAETKDVNDVRTDNTKFYVEFENGRITVHPDLIGETLNCNYYGTGSIILADDINALHDAFDTLDAAIVHTDGSNFMTSDLDLDGNNIVGFGSSGLVDGISVATHNHEGTARMGVKLSGENAFSANSFISANLNNKSISGIGAVATGNIQNDAITNVELESNKNSLTKVSGTMLVIGGASNTTVGINRTPAVSCSAEFQFKSSVSSVDKVIFHRSGGADGNSGINIDASQNLNIFTLKDTKISFRDSSATGTEYAYIDTATGDFVTPDNSLVGKTGDIIAPSKLCEGGIPLIPTGTVTVLYNTAGVPGGWSTVAINDFALRIVANYPAGSGGTSHNPGGSFENFSTWVADHQHAILAHSHSLTLDTTGVSHIVNIVMENWAGHYGAGGRNSLRPYYHFLYGTYDNHYHSGNNGTSSGLSPSYSGIPSSSCQYADVILISKL